MNANRVIGIASGGFLRILKLDLKNLSQLQACEQVRSPDALDELWLSRVAVGADMLRYTTPDPGHHPFASRTVVVIHSAEGGPE